MVLFVSEFINILTFFFFNLFINSILILWYIVGLLFIKVKKFKGINYKGVYIIVVIPLNIKV